MKTRIIFVFLLFLSTANLLAQSSGISPEEARRIISRAEEKQQGGSSHLKVTMTITRPTWSRSITMENWTLGSQFALMVITSPAKEKGMASLKRKGVLWNWQPTIERVIRVTPSMLSQSWMGSDFTNDNILRESSLANDYNHQFIGMETFDDSECYRIELLPHQDAPVVWGRVVALVDQTNNFRRMEYFDETGKLVSTMTTWDIRVLDDRSLPTLMRMTPVDQPGYRTEMRILDGEFDVALEESFFSLQRLQSFQR